MTISGDTDWPSSTMCEVSLVNDDRFIDLTTRVALPPSRLEPIAHSMGAGTGWYDANSEYARRPFSSDKLNTEWTRRPVISDTTDLADLYTSCIRPAAPVELDTSSVSFCLVMRLHMPSPTRAMRAMRAMRPSIPSSSRRLRLFFRELAINHLSSFGVMRCPSFALSPRGPRVFIFKMGDIP
jgi:hypothetical protein